MYRPYYQAYRQIFLWSKAAVLCLLLVFSVSELMAQVSGYSSSQQLATDANLVSGSSDLNNFPVLVDYTAPSLRTIANGGQVENSNGYDIIFTDSDGTTQLNHQLETYNPTTGRIVAWVQIPTLSATSDTPFFIHYGNPGITSDQSDEATWDNNYVMVHHYQDNLQDGTINGNDGTDNGTSNTPGKIGAARQFDGTDFIQVANSSTLNISDQLTISAWINSSNISSNPSLISKGDFDDAYSTYIENGGELVFDQLTQYFWWTFNLTLNSTSSINNGNWVHVTFVKNGNGRTIYLNGTASGNDDVTSNIVTNSDPLSISSASSPFNGAMDEIRISNTGRTADWISTEYANQNDPNSFIYSVNDPPVLANIESTQLDYLAGDGQITISSTLSVQDNDDTNLEGATIQFSANYQNGEDQLIFSDQNGITGSWDTSSGKLTLTGSATVAEYQDALRSVKYENTSGTPASSIRTIAYSVNDGTTTSNTESRDIRVRASNNAPILSGIESSTLSYTEGDGKVTITSSLNVDDNDDSSLDSAKVRISNNYIQGEDLLEFTDALGITGSFNTSNGTLTLAGDTSIAAYQTALRSVTYRADSPDPVTLDRTVEFIVNDGYDNSNVATRTISVSTQNSAPVLDDIETEALAYSPGDPPTEITNTITAADYDNAELQSASVQISGNYDSSQDLLNFSSMLGISGNWDATTGTLTLSGAASADDYQNALRTITYENTSSNPSIQTRTINFTISDGSLNSTSQTRDITLSVPGSISGLDLWLRGDAGVSTSSGEVVTWADYSGNGNDFTGQAGNGDRPTYVNSSSELNNQPVVNFAGDGDFMEDVDGENYIDGRSEFTLFAVIKSDETNTDRGFWNTEIERSGTDDFFTIRYDEQGANASAINLIKAGILNDDPANQLESFSDVQTTNGQIVMLQWESGNLFDLFVDGVLNNPSGASTPPTGTINLPNGNAARVIVGKGGKDDPFTRDQSWNGQIAEVILYGRRITADERKSVEDYLSDKYDIPIRLLTKATGGEAISADDANVAFTSLTGPILREEVVGKLQQGGTITLKAPTGYEWDTDSTPTASTSPAFGGTTNLAVSFTSQTTSEITFTVDQASTSPNRPGQVEFSGLRVRPTTGVLPNSGNITNVGTTGPGGTTNYGTLTMVPGEKDSLVFAQQPTNTNVNENISPAVKVQLVDQYGNEVEEGNISVDVALSSGTGTLSGTTTRMTNTLGIAQFYDLSIDSTGTKKLTVSNSGLTSTESNPFDIVSSGQFTTFRVEREPSGNITPKKAGQLFDIKISAVDGNGNVDTSFVGNATITSTGTMGTGSGTTPGFSNGVLSGHTVSITSTGNVKITATNESGSESGYSNEFPVSPGEAAAGTSQITANPEVIRNDGSSSSTITVQLKDKFGNKLTTGGDNVQLSTTAGTLSPVTDNGDGTYTAVLTASNSQEIAIISGSVNSSNIDDNAQVTFTVFDAIWESQLGDTDIASDWNLADNWSNNSVPGPGDIILIPVDPEVGNEYPVIDMPGQTAGEVAIETGADITITGGNNLTIEGRLTGGGDVNGANNDSLTVGGDVSISDLKIGTVVFNGSSKQTLTNPHTYTNLTIDNTAGVDVSDNLFINGTLTLTNGDLTIPSGKNLIANTKSIGSGQLAFERIVDGPQGWRMISSPVSSTYGELLDSTITQGYEGAFYDASVAPNDTLQPTVLWYDETYPGTDNQRWRAPTGASEALTAGRGLYVYFFGDIQVDDRYSNPLPDTLLVHGQEFEGNGTEFDFDVTYTATADTGWNFVGNPFGATLDWDASGWTKTNIDNTIYVWDPKANGGNGEYLTWNGSTGTLSNGRIPPFQGFWVKANGPAPVLKVTKNNKTTGGNFVRKAPKQNPGVTPIIGLRLTHEEGLSASANLSFQNTAKKGKDRNDAYRLLPFSDTFLELFMTLNDGTELVTNNLPEDLGERRMLIPIHVGGFREQEPLSGEFAISWPGMRNIPNHWLITLVDHKTNEEINLRAENFYRFNIDGSNKKKYKTNNAGGSFKLKEKKQSGNRFTLRISTEEIEAQIPNQAYLNQNYPNPFNPTTKIEFGLNEDSNVTLEVFDILGRKVQTLVSERRGAGKHIVDFSARGLASGVYIYRLVIGDRTFVKKFTFIK